MKRYFVRFKANSRNGLESEYTRMLDLQFPIEYDSDIKNLEELMAEEVACEYAILMDWKELKGTDRPEN